MNKKLAPHQERVVAEKKELDDKLNKLSDFIESEKFDDLDENEQDRLTMQYDIMQLYSNILETRIKYFK